MRSWNLTVFRIGVYASEFLDHWSNSIVNFRDVKSRVLSKKVGIKHNRVETIGNFTVETYYNSGSNNYLRNIERELRQLGNN